MFETCSQGTYSEMLRNQSTHIRGQSYAAALSALAHAQRRYPLAGQWGDGSTSLTDGQGFRTNPEAEETGHVNPHYSASPGKLIYNHTNDH